ncbi:hypothetical protein psyc5s11_19830 [Clostridium gelidum]|uniref:Branched-chain amino acid transport system carrier protein n=1 Tax=Clostridium gelidum TaxID=704125 RepID=A0ABN6IYV2_9CLOT|nr:hypothetical protein [Clostridium gelidum]BCZ45916.1 hypothetical protein psyc5s11_19830 [Clostridium gelidum]
MVIYLFVIVGIIFVTNASLQDQIKGVKEYSMLDKAGIVFNIILSVVYLFLYVMGFINSMAENELIITNTDEIMVPFFRFFDYLVALICIICIALSVKLRKKGNSKTAFGIQFLPLVVFLLK